MEVSSEAVGEYVGVDAEEGDDGERIRHIHFKGSEERTGDLFFKVTGATIPKLPADIEAICYVKMEGGAVRRISDGRGITDAVAHSATAGRDHALACILPRICEGEGRLVTGEAAHILLAGERRVEKEKLPQFDRADEGKGEGSATEQQGSGKIIMATHGNLRSD